MGLKKKVDLDKVSQKLNPVSGGSKSNKLMNGFGNVKKSLGKVGGMLNPKNISNMFSRNNSSSSNANSTNNFFFLRDHESYFDLSPDYSNELQLHVVKIGSNIIGEFKISTVEDVANIYIKFSNNKAFI